VTVSDCGNASIQVLMAGLVCLVAIGHWIVYFEKRCLLIGSCYS